MNGSNVVLCVDDASSLTSVHVGFIVISLADFQTLTLEKARNLIDEQMSDMMPPNSRFCLAKQLVSLNQESLLNLSTIAAEAEIGGMSPIASERYRVDIIPRKEWWILPEKQTATFQPVASAREFHPTRGRRSKQTIISQKTKAKCFGIKSRRSTLPSIFKETLGLPSEPSDVSSNKSVQIESVSDSDSHGSTSEPAWPGQLHTVIDLDSQTPTYKEMITIDDDQPKSYSFMGSTTATAPVTKKPKFANNRIFPS